MFVLIVILSLPTRADDELGWAVTIFKLFTRIIANIGLSCKYFLVVYLTDMELLEKSLLHSFS